MFVPPLLLVFLDPFPIRLLATFTALKLSSPMLATPRLPNPQMPNLSYLSASQQHWQSAHLADHLFVSSFTSSSLVLSLTLEYPRPLLDSLVHTGCTSCEGELVWHCGFQCDPPEKSENSQFGHTYFVIFILPPWSKPRSYLSSLYCSFLSSVAIFL